MKRALALAFLSLAVACGKGATNAGDGGDSGTGGSNGSGGGAWGCLNTGGSCVCQTNPPPGEYPDQACTGSLPCCYTTPPSDAQPESQCSCIGAPSAQCASIVAGFPGSTQVSNCPPGAATTGGGSTGTNSSGSGTSGSGGTSGSNAWGCANETDSCVCKQGVNTTDYPLSSCPSASCCYVATFRGTSECFCNSQLPADRCSAAVANSPGAVQVASCPAPASSGGSGTSGTSATTSTTATTATTSTNSNASNGGSGGTTSGVGGSAGTNSSGGTSTNSSAGTSTGTNSSAGTSAGSNGSLGGSSGSGGSNSGVGGSSGSTGGSNGSVGGSNASTGSTGSTATTAGTNSSAGTNAGTNASGSGGSTGTSASTGTNSSAGTTGSTATTSTGPIDYGAGTADVSGSQAFTPAGAFEETGYDSAHGVPTLNFLIFDAPMTCFMFETHYFPKYYGHLPDGRLVYSDYPDAGSLYYPNYQNVLFDRPDGGDRYYYLANGNIQDFSGSQPVTAFPKATKVVLGVIDSPNSQPVPLGTYQANNNNYMGVGYVALDSHTDAGIIDTVSAGGNVTFTSHTSSRLQGSFNVPLVNLGLNQQADDDGGIVFYPDGGISVPDGGIDAQLGATDAGFLTGHFNAVQCSF